MLPIHTEERAEYLVRVLIEMKKRWNWQISIICPVGDRNAYRHLTEPSGLLIDAPDYSRAADWESDPAAVSRIERNLSEAERIAGVPVGQWILASQQTIGCAFALPHLKFKPTAQNRFVLADNSEPYRIFLRMFGSAEEIMETTRPDLFLAYEWQKPWRSSVWMAAARRHIPRVGIRLSKLNGDHYFWTNDRTLFNDAADRLAHAKRQAGAPVSDLARSRIDAFRNRPLTVKYIRDKWDMLGKKSWLKWHVDWTRATLRQTARAATGNGRVEKSLGQIVEYNRKIIQAKRDRKYFRSFDYATLSSMKYIYFPMHKETDLPMVMQAPRWHDQRNSLQVLAAALPYGYRILAREHRMNMGTRPSHYYDQLSKLPNLTLVDPFGDQFDYIRNASLVVTENGSSGWEALLFNRPVISMSRTVYDGAGLARKVANQDEIGAEILKALSGPALVNEDEHERRLGWMLDAEFESTFPMNVDRAAEGADRLEGFLSSLEHDFNNALVDKRISVGKEAGAPGSSDAA